MRIEYPTLFLAILCYSLFIGAAILLWPVAPAAAILVMAVMGALQSSLAHECLHGHPFRNPHLNEALAYLPLTLAYPYRRYRSLHLKHHENASLTDPFEDPESYYRASWQFDRLPRPLRWLLRINNALLGRLICGPWLSVAGFFAREGGAILRGESDVRRAWAHHVAGCVPIFLLLWAMGIPVWVYIICVCWPALSLIALRSFAEHRWHETEDGRCIIVEKSTLSWLFLNNNLHLVHHAHPQVPWYDLPRLYARQKAAWRKRSAGYVFSGYRALWRTWAIRPKEPVVHPVWHQPPSE